MELRREHEWKLCFLTHLPKQMSRVTTGKHLFSRRDLFPVELSRICVGQHPTQK